MKKYCYYLFIIVLLIMTGCSKATTDNKKEEKQISSAKQLIYSNIKSLSINEINGYYRYQGQQYGGYVGTIEDEYEVEYYWGTNNYICYGTSNVNDCTSNPDRYMYRIIGVNSNGGLKLIKSEYIKSMIWSEQKKPVLWKDSEVFKFLNGDDYLNNDYYFNDTWKELIIDSIWKYGTMSFRDYNIVGGEYYDGNRPLQVEQNWKNSVKAKIGLIYPSDYYFAATSDPKGIYDSDYKEFEKTWLSSKYYEYTIATSSSTKDSYGNSGCWIITRDSDGMLSGSWKCSSKTAVRPVFNTVDGIEFSSGTGTLKKPFVIKIQNV